MCARARVWIFFSWHLFFFWQAVPFIFRSSYIFRTKNSCWKYNFQNRDSLALFIVSYRPSALLCNGPSSLYHREIPLMAYHFSVTHNGILQPANCFCILYLRFLFDKLLYGRGNTLTSSGIVQKGFSFSYLILVGTFQDFSRGAVSCWCTKISIILMGEKKLEIECHYHL